MPDQTVKVTFTAPNTFTFVPETVAMTAAGKVVFHRDPGNAAWTFVSADQLPTPEYTWSLTGNGSGLVVNDGHTSNGASHYSVTVQDASGRHSSGENPSGTAPPMIVNQ